VGLLLLLLFAGLVGLPGAGKAQDIEQDVSLRIVDVLEAPGRSTREGTVVMEVEILSGRFAGEIHRMEEHQWGHPWYDYPLREGGQFTGRVFANNGEVNRIVLEEARSDWKLLIIFLLVSVALLVVGEAYYQVRTRLGGEMDVAPTVADLGVSDD
jgi:predicted secreted protein